MTAKWTEELDKKVEAAWQDGEDPEDAVARLIDEYRDEIMLDAELRAIKRVKDRRRGEWAEPPLTLPLTFMVDGVEFAFSDAPVRWVDEDNVEHFKPARFSTSEERLASFEAQISHHQGWVRRAEANHSHEQSQAAKAAALGIDLTRITLDELLHTTRGTTCWRCGEGYREGDPFETGHCDKPKSQGGTQTAYEHRSCNRSAKANPAAPLELD